MLTWPDACTIISTTWLLGSILLVSYAYRKSRGALRRCEAKFYQFLEEAVAESRRKESERGDNTQT